MPRKGSPAYQALAPAGLFRFLPEPGRGRFRPPMPDINKGFVTFDPRESAGVNFHVTKADALNAIGKNPELDYHSVPDYLHYNANPNPGAPIEPDHVNYPKATGTVPPSEEGAKHMLQRAFDNEVERRAKDARLERIREISARQRTQMEKLLGEANQASESPKPAQPEVPGLTQAGRIGTGVATGVAGAAVIDFLTRYAQSYGRTPGSKGIRYVKAQT